MGEPLATLEMLAHHLHLLLPLLKAHRLQLGKASQGQQHQHQQLLV
jgi:hypothetical protein